MPNTQFKRLFLPLRRRLGMYAWQCVVTRGISHLKGHQKDSVRLLHCLARKCNRYMVIIFSTRAIDSKLLHSR